MCLLGKRNASIVKRRSSQEPHCFKVVFSGRRGTIYLVTVGQLNECVLCMCVRNYAQCAAQIRKIFKYIATQSLQGELIRKHASGRPVRPVKSGFSDGADKLKCSTCVCLILIDFCSKIAFYFIVSLFL